MAMRKVTMGAVVAVAVIALIVSVLGAALVATRTVSNTGTITAVGVGVYTTSACTTSLTAIPWGTINPGSVTTYTMYVKNTGNAQVTLNMTTSSWSPSTASSYITLTWNATGTVVSAGSYVAAVLTLTVSSSITGITSFSFNTTISGTH